MGRSASQCYDNRKYDQPNNDTNLDAWQPKFEFTKNSNPEVVNTNYHGQKDCNPYAGVNFVTVNPVSRLSASSDTRSTGSQATQQ